MQVDDVVLAHPPIERAPERRRSEEPRRRSQPEIPHAHAVAFDGPVERHREAARTVGVGGEDLDPVAGRGLGARQAVHRADRTAVAPGRQVARDDVQDLQAALRAR